jgi:hypothetical protein
VVGEPQRFALQQGDTMIGKPENRLTLSEFHALVHEIKGDCDKCKMGCRDRLRIMDHQIQRQEKAIQRFEVVTEALAEIVVQSHPDSFQRKINELTARILADAAKELEGPKNERETDECQGLSAGFYREIS